MALRRAVSHVQNENPTTYVAAKLHVEQPAKDIKRSAFGDVGNKIPKPTEQNGLKAQTDNIKKPVIQPIKNATKKVIVRQESMILKKNPPVENKLPVTKKLSTNFSRSVKETPIQDVDEKIKHQPFMVPEYLMDIFNYLREQELNYLIRDNYLEDHESTPAMRSILVNWLVEVHQNFKLELETLHICIGVLDRYLQENKKIGKSTLQLVGASALLVASKYEEIYVPDLEDFEYICDSTYSKRQILQMEKEILKKLDFKLGRPISINFLRRYNKIAEARLEHHMLGKYLLELALLDYGFCSLGPSVQAAAACCLSLAIINEVMDVQKLWTPTLVHYTSHSYADIKPVIAKFAKLIVSTTKSNHQAIRKKYSHAKFMKISLSYKLNGPLVRKLTVAQK